MFGRSDPVFYYLISFHLANHLVLFMFARCAHRLAPPYMRPWRSRNRPGRLFV